MCISLVISLQFDESSPVCVVVYYLDLEKLTVEVLRLGHVKGGVFLGEYTYSSTPVSDPHINYLNIDFVN